MPLSGVVAQYDASVQSAGSLLTWNATVGPNALNAGQPATVVSAALNGLSTVRFTAAALEYYIASTSIVGPTIVSMVASVNEASFSDYRGAFCSGVNGSAGDLAAVGNNGTVDWYPSQSDLAYYKNGSLDAGLDAPINGVFWTMSFLSSHFSPTFYPQIGLCPFGATGARIWLGDIAEIVVGNDQTQRVAYESYLTSKWFSSAAPVTVPLAAPASASASSFVVTAATKAVLATSVSVSAATGALSSKTAIALAAVASASAAAVSASAAPRLSLQTTASVSATTGALTATTQFPAVLGVASTSSITGSFSSTVLIPLVSSVSTSSSNASISASGVAALTLALSASASTSTGALTATTALSVSSVASVSAVTGSISAGSGLVLNSASSSIAAGALTAPTAVTVGRSSSVSSAALSLGVVGPAVLVLNPVGSASIVTLAYFVPAELAVGSLVTSVKTAADAIVSAAPISTLRVGAAPAATVSVRIES